MGPQEQLEKEEQHLEKLYGDGLISKKEYDQQLKDLHRDYRAEAEDSAWEARQRELDNW